MYYSWKRAFLKEKGRKKEWESQSRVKDAAGNGGRWKNKKMMDRSRRDIKKKKKTKRKKKKQPTKKGAKASDSVKL